MYILRAISGIVHAHHSCGGKRGKLSGSRLSTIFKFASIQGSDTFTSGGCFFHFLDKKVIKMCPIYLLTRYYKCSSQYQTLIKIDLANSLQYTILSSVYRVCGYEYGRFSDCVSNIYGQFGRRTICPCRLVVSASES